MCARDILSATRLEIVSIICLMLSSNTGGRSVLRARALLLAGMFSTVTLGGQPPARPSAEVAEATIADLQQRMQSGQETSRSLVEKYLARIEAIDRGGPAPHSAIDEPEASRLPTGSMPSARADRAVRCTAHLSC
jgi:hypothetical protein